MRLLHRSRLSPEGTISTGVKVVKASMKAKKVGSERYHTLE